MKKPKLVNGQLTAERLRQLMTYQPETGELHWIVRPSYCMREGDRVGGKNSTGYVTAKIDGKSYQVHRLVWLYVHGQWPKAEIDHINGEKSDNRIDNLRDVSRSQNMLNQHRPRKDNRVGAHGVHRRTANGLYRALIQKNGKRYYLGQFANVEDARRARAEAAQRLATGGAV